MRMSSTFSVRAGFLLRVARLRAELGQEVLARRLKVSQATVSRWERGLGRIEAGQAAAWLELCQARREVREAVAAYFAAGDDSAREAAALEVERLAIDLVRGSGLAYDTAVPYFADVAAGLGEAQEQRSEPRRMLQVPAEVLERDPGCYALRVVGDSMAPRLTDGDIVVVSPTAPLIDGCIVAAYIEPDGDVVKVYRRLSESEVLLQPLNPDYPALVLAVGTWRSARIWGRVVFMQREM